MFLQEIMIPLLEIVAQTAHIILRNQVRYSKEPLQLSFPKCIFLVLYIQK